MFIGFQSKNISWLGRENDFRWEGDRMTVSTLISVWGPLLLERSFPLKVKENHQKGKVDIFFFFFWRSGVVVSVCLFSKSTWFWYKCSIFGLFYISGGGIIISTKNYTLMNEKRAIPVLIPVLSLNVNGLFNPVKRSNIMNKLKKERTLVNILQETHLSEAEHEKLKRFGSRHT